MVIVTVSLRVEVLHCFRYFTHSASIFRNFALYTYPDLWHSPWLYSMLSETIGCIHSFSYRYLFPTSHYIL